MPASFAAAVAATITFAVLGAASWWAVDSEHDHTSSGMAFSALPMAEIRRFHAAVSSRSRRLPEPVSV
jgi:hypothetical protein